MSLGVLTAVSGISGVFLVMIFLQVVVMISSKFAQVVEKSMSGKGENSN